MLSGTFDRIMRLIVGAAMLAIVVLVSVAPAEAQSNPQASSNGEMIVATHEAPPFAIKEPNGEWHGLAIDLWRSIASERNYRFRFVETDIPGMIDGVVSGKYDASVGALTITPEREKVIDFTHAFYATGYGMAVRKSPPAWLLLLSNFFTWSFLQAVLALAMLLCGIGFLFWLAERKHNDEEFSRGWRGIGSGLWFAAVTMTTVGYGDKAPRTPLGKLIALIWMFAAILIISIFTGMIASSLTAGRLTGSIAGPDDLPNATIGSIAGSSSDEWLKKDGLGFTGYPDVKAGLTALRDGDIDVFVYDDPLLRYQLRNGFDHDLRMVPGTFGRQDYAIALAQGSDRREAIDLALLRRIRSDEWRRSIVETLGQRK